MSSMGEDGGGGAVEVLLAPSLPEPSLPPPPPPRTHGRGAAGAVSTAASASAAASAATAAAAADNTPTAQPICGATAPTSDRTPGDAVRGEVDTAVGADAPVAIGRCHRNIGNDLGLPAHLGLFGRHVEESTKVPPLSNFERDMFPNSECDLLPCIPQAEHRASKLLRIRRALLDLHP